MKRAEKMRRRITKAVRDRIWAENDGRCNWCGVSLQKVLAGNLPRRVIVPNLFTVDHVIPLAAGGENRIANLVAACFCCNQSRGKGEVRRLEKEKRVSEQSSTFSLGPVLKEALPEKPHPSLIAQSTRFGSEGMSVQI